MHDTQAMTKQQHRITGGHLAHRSRGVTNSKHWRILAPKRTKLISLLSLLPAWWIPRFLSSFEVASVMLLFCCRVYLHWWPILTPSVCNMLLCSLYLHWWRTLMPSGCNMCNSGNRLELIACLFISLLSCLVVCL